MSAIVFLNGNNFHIEKIEDKYVVYYQNEGSCYKVEVVNNVISQPIKLSQVEEIAKLKDGRYVKRVNDLIVISEGE